MHHHKLRPAALFFLLCASAVAQTTVQNFTYTAGSGYLVTDPSSIAANTNVVVSSGAAVIYHSGGAITLGPGFTAQAGSSFHAYITGSIFSLVGQPAVFITPTVATVATGQSVTLFASGGAGTGNFVWGGAGVGTGPMITIPCTTAGSLTVTVYRAGDSNYQTSSAASATITVLTATPDSGNANVQLKMAIPTQ